MLYNSFMHKLLIREVAERGTRWTVVPRPKLKRAPTRADFI